MRGVKLFIMKKVAFFMASPFTYGGEQRVVSVVANLLTSQNYDVSIICSENTKIDLSLYDLNKNVKIHFLPECVNFTEKVCRKLKRKILDMNARIGILSCFPKLNEKMYSLSSYKKRLINHINEEKYDYIIGVASYYSIVAASIAKFINTKVIGWQHNNYYAYFETKGRRFYNEKRMFYNLCSNFNSYVVLMNLDKENIEKRYPIKCTHIFNPGSFRENGMCDIDKHIFLSYGRFSKIKGYDMLIEAYKKYKEMGGTWKLDVVGEGEERENIILAIKEKKLENDIIIHEFTENIQEYLEKSSALLVSSRWEGCSMTFNEALQFGLPIIAFDINNFIEVTKGYESAILVPQFDIEKFAKEMLKLERDRALRCHMSEEAHKNTVVFNDKKILKQWKKILK